MPAFKPAYLIHGDDHVRIAQRRNRLRALAESESGAQGVEVIEGDGATPEAAAAALNAMTFAIGRRFIVVDGAERFKEKELESLEAAMADLPPDTTIAFFAREEGRNTAPKRLHEAVRKAGGDISVQANVKPWELPKWVIERGRELGLRIEPDAARALVAHVGERQPRLMRELEKLALGCGEGSTIDVTQVEELTAPSAERKVWSLADALLETEPAHALELYLELRSQGERVPGLIYWMSSRVRTAHEVASALEAGQAASQVKRGLRMPSRAADRLIADAGRAGSERLRRATCEIADLELASRGGGSRALSEDSAAVLAVRRITG